MEPELDTQAALGLGEAGDRPGDRQAGTEISRGGPGRRHRQLGGQSSYLSKCTDRVFANTRVLANVMHTHTHTRAKSGGENRPYEQAVPWTCHSIEEDKGGAPWAGMRLGGSWCSHSRYLF